MSTCVNLSLRARPRKAGSAKLALRRVKDGPPRCLSAGPACPRRGPERTRKMPGIDPPCAMWSCSAGASPKARTRTVRLGPSCGTNGLARHTKPSSSVKGILESTDAATAQGFLWTPRHVRNAVRHGWARRPMSPAAMPSRPLSSPGKARHMREALIFRPAFSRCRFVCRTPLKRGAILR